MAQPGVVLHGVWQVEKLQVQPAGLSKFLNMSGKTSHDPCEWVYAIAKGYIEVVGA